MVPSLFQPFQTIAITTATLSRFTKRIDCGLTSPRRGSVKVWSTQSIFACANVDDCLDPTLGLPVTNCAQKLDRDDRDAYPRRFFFFTSTVRTSGAPPGRVADGGLFPGIASRKAIFWGQVKWQASQVEVPSSKFGGFARRLAPKAGSLCSSARSHQANVSLSEAWY